MKKEILTDELKNNLAEISGKDCPYYIYAFKAEASRKHGKDSPFFYVSNGSKDSFKDASVELIRLPLSGDFYLKLKHCRIKEKDIPYLCNFLNNNYYYLLNMWHGTSNDYNIFVNIKTDWSLHPAKEYYTSDLSFELTWFEIKRYGFFFFSPFWNMPCEPFIYVSNGYVRNNNRTEKELVRFSLNGFPISDTELRIKEEDLPKIRRFILANKELILKAWYWIWTDTSSFEISNELKKVWD